MPIEYTPWPAEAAAEYRRRGFWQDVPLSDILERQQTNDAVAVIDGARHWTYRELHAAAAAFAGALQARGLRQHDTALVQLGNTVEHYITFFAMMQAGIVPVNALASHRESELSAYAAQIRPKVLVVDRKYSEEYIASLGVEFVVFRDEIAGLPPSAVVKCPTSEVAFLNLSGGSTGTPKLIPRTHNDYFYSVRQSNVVCAFSAATRYLVAIPAAHNFPMSSPGALGVFCAGGTVVLASDPSAGTCFPLIKAHRVTVAALVPPAAALWLDAFDNSDVLASLELLQLGGARLSPTLALKLTQAFGCALQQVFGMAEGLVNYTRLDDPPEVVLETQGRPMSEADEVWVAGPDGQRLGPDEVGLLMTRGPYTFRGYYGAPEHNAKSFTNGFYCSGDLVSINRQGCITVHGRQKDQINRGGEKISTEEIENLLLRHPDVLEAGLVAVADEVMGEKSVAFVVVKRPVKAPVLRRFLREQRIAEYKLPDRFEVLEEMPLTAVGKVDKQRLRVLKV